MILRKLSSKFSLKEQISTFSANLINMSENFSMIYFTFNLIRCQTLMILLSNKKVLLCERKMHTTCHIASACSTALSFDWGGVPPSSPDWGVVPPSSLEILHPVLMEITPSSPDEGTRGYHHPVLIGVHQVPPSTTWGTSCQQDGGTPQSAGQRYPQSGRMG